MPWFGSHAGVSTLDRTPFQMSVSNADSTQDSRAVSRELQSLAGRVHRDHPGVSLEEITAIACQEHEELAPAPVQTFRAILTERAVRRRVGSHRSAER